MNIFKINPTEISNNATKRVYKSIAIITINYFIICVFIYFFLQNTDNTIFYIFLFYYVAIVFLMMILGIKRLKKMFASYTLTINDDHIKREQHYFSDIIILNSEIKKISKNKKGIITIKSNSIKKSIHIPNNIDNKEELEKILNNISPIIQTTSILNYELLRPFISILTIGAYFTLIYSENKLKVAISGTVCLLLILLSIYINFNNKTMPKQSTSRFLLQLVFIAITVYVMYTKLYSSNH